MPRESGAPAAQPTDLKYANRAQVIGAFLDGNTYSVNDISAMTGLSRQTVMKSVQFFLKKGLLAELGKGDSTPIGGKRPTLYKLPEQKFFLCIALWPQELRLSLYTLGGKLVDSSELIAYLPRDPKAAIDNVGLLADSLLLKNGISKEAVLGVSISTAGTVDYKTGRLKYSSQTPLWGSDVPLLDYLRPHFLPGTLLFLENAGKMTARPMLLEPELTGKRILTIFSCWGLSSCLIEKGHILGGRNSLIGEIGHMVVFPTDPELCGCGSHGCLERLVCIERIQEKIKESAQDYPDSPLPQISCRLTIPELFAWSAKGDALARHTSEILAGAFAIALRNISLVFDPDLVVFQGDYSFADELFRKTLTDLLSQFQYYPAGGPFEIRYDQRSLSDMDSLGSFAALQGRYFKNTELFDDLPEEHN